MSAIATTRLISLHVGKGRTIAAAIGQSTDYAMNPDKTADGELISTYQCTPQLVDAEFLLAKREYHSITGREQPKNRDVFAYHIRQSFKPGEIQPEAANRIGYKLAMSFTKGNHAFIVATHIDRHHIHSHIIFNSTSLDYTKKFDDFLGSARAIRRISDQLCVENGLSVIENPKRKGKHYGQWLGADKKLSYQAQMKQAIDAALEKKPPRFDDFLHLLEAAGIEVIRGGKHLKFRAPGQTKPTRCDTLRGDYTEQAIRESITGKRVVPLLPQTVNLLINIEQKIRAGKGPGYEMWAKTHNLKLMAKTLIYLQEQGITHRDDLSARANAAADRFHALAGQIKKLEAQMNDNAALQKHIINYSKTRAIYASYREAGYSKKFLAQNEQELALHKSAKEAFDRLGLKRLPSVPSLRQEYSALLGEKKNAYSEYKQARETMRQLFAAKANVQQILGADLSEYATRDTDQKR